jgi:hypothetical protein
MIQNLGRNEEREKGKDMRWRHRFPFPVSRFPLFIS